MNASSSMKIAMLKHTLLAPSISMALNLKMYWKINNYIVYDVNTQNYWGVKVHSISGNIRKRLLYPTIMPFAKFLLQNCKYYYEESETVCLYFIFIKLFYHKYCFRINILWIIFLSVMKYFWNYNANIELIFWNSKEPTAYGKLNKKCGVYLLVNENLATWTEAEEYCCSIGMDLLTVFSVEKQTCLFDVLSKRIYIKISNSYKT